MGTFGRLLMTRSGVENQVLKKEEKPGPPSCFSDCNNSNNCTYRKIKSTPPLTHTHTDTHTEGRVESEKEGDRDRQIETERDGDLDKQTGRQTDKEINGNTDRDGEQHFAMNSIISKGLIL